MDLALNNLQSLICHKAQTNKQTYIANIAFACKSVNERTFLESGHIVIEIRGK